MKSSLRHERPDKDVKKGVRFSPANSGDEEDADENEYDFFEFVFFLIVCSKTNL